MGDASMTVFRKRAVQLLQAPSTAGQGYKTRHQDLTAHKRSEAQWRSTQSIGHVGAAHLRVEGTTAVLFQNMNHKNKSA